jgi:hypothetical protein
VVSLEEKSTKTLSRMEEKNRGHLTIFIGVPRFRVLALPDPLFLPAPVFVLPLVILLRIAVFTFYAVRNGLVPRVMQVQGGARRGGVHLQRRRDCVQVRHPH